jgi:hypothetical protein
VTEWSYTPAMFKGRFDDLIFTPLDLEQPPDVDADSFVNWMSGGQDPMQTEPMKAYERLNKKPYPWLMKTLNGDLSSLQSAFPDVYRYLSVFPFKEVRTLVILAQHGEQSVFTHTDSDGLCGMRFYLKSKNAEGLHFYKGKAPYDKFDSFRKRPDGTFERCVWENYFVMDEPVFATFPQGVRTFMLNSGRAAHSVAPNTCQLGDRIAVLVQGEYDLDRRDELLARSLVRYTDHTIWY